MNETKRQVDRAMDEEREQKVKVRDLWLEEIRRLNQDFKQETESQSQQPLYLTLSGSEGLDIERLIEEGIVDVNENGNIASHNEYKVVAVESSSNAVYSLKEKFPGLKIEEKPIQNLVRGSTPFSWPDNEKDKSFCRAKVVNLDLNESLSIEKKDRGIEFPVISWIKKIGRLHADSPPVDWSLLLTLHGEFQSQAEEYHKYTLESLKDNFQTIPDFKEFCSENFNTCILEAIKHEEHLNLSELPPKDQQSILVVFVPKRIIWELSDQGWNIHTKHSLSYGDIKKRQAPMITWVMNFRWEEDADSQPQQSYKRSIQKLQNSLGRINRDGNIES